MLVTNVTSESVNGIKILAVGPASTLRGGEKVGMENDRKKFIVETLLENHDTYISQTDTTVVVRVEGIEGRYFTGFVHEDE